jgi:hypothetical protein
VLKWALWAIVALLALLGAVFLAIFVYTMVGASDTELAQAEGRTFGLGVTDTKCLPKALTILQERQPLLIPFYEASFLDACLDSSAPSEELCRGVPDPLDEEARMTWSEELCRESRATTIACSSLVSQIIFFCAERPSRPG